MKNLEAVKKLARDLRSESPRDPSEQLGGFEKAARCVDKCRATLVGWEGDFTYGCPMDRRFLDRAGVVVEEFKQFVGTGAADDEIAKWLQQHSKDPHPATA